MPKSSVPEGGAGFRLALVGIVLVTLWRVVLLSFNATDLYVDEAQYWFWGQELAWGYYSKPPLIGWLLRLSTEIGAVTAFWVRLPLPLIHAGTAVIVALLGRRLFGARIGGLAGFGFVCLPAVALGSLLVSTDTPMLLCFAMALLAFDHLRKGRSAGWALVMGGAIGVGLLSKYAMIYFPVSSVIAAAVLPAARIAPRDALVAAVVALALIAPNLLWNAANDFATLQHTADNTDLESGVELDVAKLAEFVLGQFLVAGPVFFGAYLAGLFRWRSSPNIVWLGLMSLPILLIVSVQALVSGANANWAAAGHVGAVLVAAWMLADRRGWLVAGLGINLAVTVALPLATVVADRWMLGENLALERYVGQAAVSRWIAEVATEDGADTVVADNRALLADMFFTLRDSELSIYAAPVAGFPSHHYAQKHPLPPGEEDVLFVHPRSRVPDCADPGAVIEPAARWTPELGFVTREITVWRMPRSCWYPEAG